jgi:hypothetical protein
MPRKTARSMANRNTHLERSSLVARYVDFLFVPLLVASVASISYGLAILILTSRHSLETIILRLFVLGEK